jgi:serine/threonine protein kinase/tetratricopeptide (TPR) repeat protein
MSLVSGSRLGPYEVGASLGAGGMGEVYRATDTQLARQVAIKVLPAEVAADPDRLVRFEREAKALAALNHPHIAQIYGIEAGPPEGGRHVRALVMELVEGPTLAERIASGPMRLADAVPIAAQIADALEAAHARGIVHRDLKPANVKVRPDGVVKLLDFGLAKVDGGPIDATQTSVGVVVGTGPYMSPEQARGEAIDSRSDVFSFGAVLYELLSGRRAFPGDSMLDILNAVAYREPASLDSPAAPIVTRCLAKQPSQRYQTMAAVKAALQAMRGARPAVDAAPSIAVLPFANMSRDADDEYFSDGLAEEIINLLAQMPGLKVIARTSAFAFKGKNEDIRRIADTLGVTTVLEGSVRRAGSRIRVTAQLIQAADGSHLWSQRFDREMTDIFALQDEIAAAIAETLKVKLAPLTERRMPNLAAYEAYLRYRSYQWRFTPEAATRSRECLQQALALDPSFALPYVGLADSYLALAAVSAIAASEAMPKARQLAQQALEIDPDLPEAHAMLGIVAGHYDFDWTEAQRRFQPTTAREPLSPHLRTWRSFFHLFSVGRADEALRESARVLEDDPLSQMWFFTRSFILQGAGLEDEALAASRTTVALDPDFWTGWVQQGRLLALHGRHDEALHCAERGYAAAPWSPMSIGLMAATFANVGDLDKARACLDTLVPDQPGVACGMAVEAVSRGDLDGSVEWLTKAVDDRNPGLVNLIVRPLEPRLRLRPGWPALLKKMNLVAAPGQAR